MITSRWMVKVRSAAVAGVIRDVLPYSYKEVFRIFTKIFYRTFSKMLFRNIVRIQKSEFRINYAREFLIN